MSESFYNAKNLIVSNGFVRNPERYYLEDFFTKLPYVSGLKHSAITARGSVHTNTTIETALASNTIPANSLVAGDTIHIVGMAQVIYQNGSDTSTIRLRLGATSAVAATEIAASAALDVATDDDIYVDMYITIRTIGSTGTMVGHGQIRTDAAGGTLLNIILPSTAINTTVTNYIGFTNDWSVANAGNQMAADSFIVDINHQNNYIENNNFEILGTNATDSAIAFSSTRAGISLTTAGMDNDQVILLPHLDTNSTAWTGIKWGTENEVEWECAVSVANVSNVAFWAGLKLTNTPVLATDANQAYFFFDTDDSVVGTLTVNTTLHFGYSVSGTDYTTNLGITVGADTIYRLRIVIDNYRQVSVFVNGLQYGLTTTAGTAGLTVANSTQKGLQLTNDINLNPYIGVQSTTAAADTLTVNYEKISRILFE
jgi:hypothetical protein